MPSSGDGMPRIYWAIHVEGFTGSRCKWFRDGDSLASGQGSRILHPCGYGGSLKKSGKSNTGDILCKDTLVIITIACCGRDI